MGATVTRSPCFQLTGFLSRGIARSSTALYELPADFSCHRISYFKRTGNRERGRKREDQSVSLRDDRRWIRKAWTTSSQTLRINMYIRSIHIGHRASARTYVKLTNRVAASRIRDGKLQKRPLNRWSLLPHRILISATTSRLSVRLSTDKKMHHTRHGALTRLYTAIHARMHIYIHLCLSPFNIFCVHVHGLPPHLPLVIF